MNVFTDIFNKISIIYYVLMSINITLVRATISELYGSTMLLMEGDPVGGGGAGSASDPSGTASGPTSGTGRGSASGTGRDSITISDICNPQGPNTETGGTKIRPIAERPTDITFGPRGGIIPPFRTLAEIQSDGD